MEDEPQFDDHSPPATESSDQLKEEVLPSVRFMDESEAKELDPSNPPPPQCEDAGRERSMEEEDAGESSKVAERDDNAASLFREEEGKDRVFEKLQKAEVDEKVSFLEGEDDKSREFDEEKFSDEKVPTLREEDVKGIVKEEEEEEENVSVFDDGAQLTEQLKEEEEVSIVKDEKVPISETSAVDETMQECDEEKLLEESGDKDEKQEESIEKDGESSSDKEEDEEMDMDEGGPAMAAGRRTGSKRKRGLPGRPRTTQGCKPREPPKPKEDEELCFICFDGGDLVVCDHRGCPKVYHPSCVNRDEDYFKAKGQWNCGWHICSNCQKSARYMCYTCTYSLCKRCIKDSGFACVRGNKGFCETCMKTVMLIETDKHENETKDVDFDDKTSWMYLFKDYWVDLKAKLSLSLEEITSARNPVKETNAVPLNEESLDKSDDADDDKIRHITTRRRKESTSRHHKESTLGGHPSESVPQTTRTRRSWTSAIGMGKAPSRRRGRRVGRFWILSTDSGSAEENKAPPVTSNYVRVPISELSGAEIRDRALQLPRSQLPRYMEEVSEEIVLMRGQLLAFQGGRVGSSRGSQDVPPSEPSQAGPSRSRRRR